MKWRGLSVCFAYLSVKGRYRKKLEIPDRWSASRLQGEIGLRLIISLQVPDIDGLVRYRKPLVGRVQLQ